MIEIVLAFLAGLLIGSFLNVCVFRLPRDLSVVKPARSFCPFCEETIAWYDNIPILSFILLRARCRHCGARIPVRYPLVELATGIAFAICVACFRRVAARVEIRAVLRHHDHPDRLRFRRADPAGRIHPGRRRAGIDCRVVRAVPAGEFALFVVPYPWGPRGFRGRSGDRRRRVQWIHLVRRLDLSRESGIAKAWAWATSK